MVRKLGTLILAATIVWPIVSTAGEPPAEQFIATLDNAVGTCKGAADLFALQIKFEQEDAEFAGTLDDFTQGFAGELEAEQAKEKACADDATAKASGAYKAFLSASHSKPLVADAKKVYAAWLTYISAARWSLASDARSIEETAYIQAKSEMRANL